ncbi:hypothetical protein L5515_017203 [Caenorhabditis briggsae]|uniref:Uncharacterized protein n=1 Tax=Caenorhabditis briggsae TaxID=6238 RepID=A0AAE9FCP6_CAEBR|nr:hypothetical protein L5515_017203 [Caenorhabditis briggsae]
MLSAEQSNCLNLIICHLPEHVKKSTMMMVDVIDDSMRHIMGGDPLESLRIKALRQVLSDIAPTNQNFIDFLKIHHLENFGNSLFNKSPEIMTLMFKHCPWENTHADKRVKISLKAKQWIVIVDDRKYVDIQHSDGLYVVPYWFPCFMHRFTSEGIRSIDVHFEGGPDELDDLLNYEKRTFNELRNFDFSDTKTTTISSKTTVNWKYVACRGSVCYTAHAKRVGSAQAFAKFDRKLMEGDSVQRNITDLIKTDLC